jgi:sialic acid synthase SpsE
MGKLMLLTYDHRHGTDIVAAAVPDDWTETQAIKAARTELEAEYSKEELQKETEEFGGVDYHHDIKDGELLVITDPEGEQYTFRVNITRVM